LTHRMNTNTKTPSGVGIVSRIKSSGPCDERPPDREVRRLHGLSADVGAACSAWLVSRGIKTRSWGDFNVSRYPRKRPKLEVYD